MTLAVLALGFALSAFFSLQLPLIAPALGLWWLDHHEAKRMALRGAALAAYGGCVWTEGAGWAVAVLSVPFWLLWLGSFVFSSTALFKPLQAHEVIKTPLAVGPGLAGAEAIGVVGPKETAVAYLLNELVGPRHLLNDVIDEVALLVTFCPACGSCVVFSRKVGDQVLRFDVAAGLHQRNMLMRDLETGSLWQQSTGQAISGPLRGSELSVFPYQQLTVEAWRQAQPNSLVARAAATAPRGLVSQERLARALALMTRPVRDARSLRAPVLGLVVNGEALAFSRSDLEAAGRVQCRLGGLELEVVHDQQTGFTTCRDARGRLIPLQRHWRLAWLTFHPESRWWPGDVGLNKQFAPKRSSHT